MGEQNKKSKITKKDIEKKAENLKQKLNNLSEVIGLINTYIRFRKIEEARALIEQAYELFPDKKAINDLEAKLENKIRNFKVSQKISEDVLKRYPNDGYAINNMIASYCGLNQLDVAEQYILNNRPFMKKITQNVMYNKLAKIYAEQGEVVKLKQLIEEFKSCRDEIEFNNYMAEGLVYLEAINGNFEEAERQVEKMPNDLNRTYKFLMLGLYDKAQETFDSLDKETVSDVELYGLQARLAAFQGRKSEAQRCVEEAKMAASIEDPYPEHYERQVDRINHIYSLIKQAKLSEHGYSDNKELCALYKIVKQERNYNILSLFRVNGISFEEKQEDIDLFEELYTSSLYIQSLKTQLDRARQQGNLEQFRSLCYELIRVDPYNVRARERLLLDAIESSNIENAEILTQEILKLDPDNMLVALYKIHAKQPTQNKKEQDDSLIQVTARLLETDWTPNITEKNRRMESINLNELQRMKRKFYLEHDSGLEEAIETGKEIMSLNPTDTSIRIRLADDLRIRKREEEAEAILLEGISYDKDNYSLVSKMFTLARTKRNLSETKYWAKRKIEIDPNSINTLASVFSLAEDKSKEKADIARRMLVAESRNQAYTSKMRQIAQSYLESIGHDMER